MRWDVCYVLFLTYDVPFEEVLVICLLSKQFKLIDKAFLGGSYTTGNFRSLKIVQGNRLQFEFIGEAFWEIELLDRKQLRIPFIYDEAGVSRDIGFSRRFIVRKLLKNQGQG